MKRKIFFLVLLLLDILIPYSGMAQTESVLWSENFEGDWTQNWYADNGVWEVGTPTSGPNVAHGGVKCAGTIIGGNYPNYANTRFIRSQSFTVPAASQNPRLRFWNWFNSEVNDDYMKVQVKVNGSSTWNDLPGTFSGGSGVWTDCTVDLAGYADQSIQIAFYFISDYYSEYAGFYIDDIRLITGPYTLSPQDFESGYGDWYAASGTWEWGIPSSGPSMAHSGQHCVGTRIAGNYQAYSSSRLTSPPFTVPAASQNPRLRFWNWFNSEVNDDYMKVQVKVYGSSTWNDLPGTFSGGSGAWTDCTVDLAGYANENIQVAFYFNSDDYYEHAGFYIDDIRLITGPYTLSP
ncbi:MAG TPA: immune inhibitor A, partial [Bacteroidales bacterium]|nr:immune inhibitor A [Bacteroidales bacterium]